MSVYPACSKRRGKRPSAASASASPTDGATSPASDDASNSSKRRRTEDGGGGEQRPLTEYEKEVRKLESRLLKDEGSSLRPLMK